MNLNLITAEEIIKNMTNPELEQNFLDNDWDFISYTDITSDDWYEKGFQVNNDQFILDII